MGTSHYTEYAVELQQGEIASASNLEQCQKYGPRQRILHRLVTVSEAGGRLRYSVGEWLPE